MAEGRYRELLSWKPAAAFTVIHHDHRTLVLSNTIYSRIKGHDSCDTKR